MGFVVEQLLLNALATFVVYSLISLAMVGQFSYLKIVSVSLVTSLIGGAYAAKWTFENASWFPVFLSISVAIIIGALLAFLGALIHRKIGHEHSALGLLASLGYLRVIQGGIVVATGGAIEVFPFCFKSLLPQGAFGSQPSWLFGGLLAVAICGLVIIILFRRTRIGLEAIAIGDDYELASVFGIPNASIGILVQVAGGCIAGLAGVILAFDSGLRPDLGFGVVLKVFAILILARTNMLFILVSAFLLAALEQISGYWWGGQLSQAFGISCLLVIIFGKSIRERIVLWNTKSHLTSSTD